MQNSLFETHIDLSYIDENISVSELGRALVRESNRVGDEQLKNHLRQMVKDLDLYVDPVRSQKLFFSTFVDAFFKYKTPNGRLTTAINVWWKALALDLQRPDLLSDPKKIMINIARIKGINNWHEFSFLVKDLFNENGGFRFFAEFKHVVWLVRALQQNVYKLQDFRNSFDVRQIKNARKIDVDQVQKEIDARLNAAFEEIDDKNEDVGDIDDMLLSWNGD